ncbi:MAG: PIN-like domain-containing protein, partial [Streptosporangiaceae bacterium]
EDTAKDPVITALSSILKRNVGDPLTADELRKAKKEALQRIADKRPPGWKDANKRDNPEGDYIVWFQTLQEARRRGVDVLFVTGDVKDDWWRREQGEVRGPLPELVYEMRAVADVRLFMLRPASLLIHAGDALGLRISEESVQDAQRVSSDADVSLNDDIRESLRTLTAELLATQEELYLIDWKPDIVRALRRASMELYDALRNPSVKNPVEAVWPVINVAVESGLLGDVKESQSESRLGMQTTKLRLVLDQLYTRTIRAWLNNIADQYVDEIIRYPHAFSYSGPLPPMVTSVGERLVASMGNRQRMQFVAYITDGHEVAITRIIMKSDEL